MTKKEKVNRIILDDIQDCYIVGDIHGEYGKLCSLLDEIAPEKDDTIIFMGDYIDRGAKSKEVVDKVISMKDVCNCVYLIGSHEYALLHSGTDEYRRRL